MSVYTCPPVTEGALKNSSTCLVPNDPSRIWTKKFEVGAREHTDGNLACRSFFGPEFACSKANTNKISSNCSPANSSGLIGDCRYMMPKSGLSNPLKQERRWLCYRKNEASGGCSADKIDCCLGDKLKVGDKSCPVELVKFGAKCPELLSGYCNTPDKLQSDTKCLKWQAAQPGPFNAFARGICAQPGNASHPYCRTYYPQTSPVVTNGGTVDPTVTSTGFSNTSMSGTSAGGDVGSGVGGGSGVQTGGTVSTTGSQTPPVVNTTIITSDDSAISPMNIFIIFIVLIFAAVLGSAIYYFVNVKPVSSTSNVGPDLPSPAAEVSQRIPYTETESM